MAFIKEAQIFPAMAHYPLEFAPFVAFHSATNPGHTDSVSEWGDEAGSPPSSGMGPPGLNLQLPQAC
jgi:hypothetical protein